jgi:hypothetical protein
MTAMAQSEKSNVRELSLEEMEKVSGGVTFNEIIWGIVIRLKCEMAGGLQISRAPLR